MMTTTHNDSYLAQIYKDDNTSNLTNMDDITFSNDSEVIFQEEDFNSEVQEQVIDWDGDEFAPPQMSPFNSPSDERNLFVSPEKNPIFINNRKENVDRNNGSQVIVTGKHSPWTPPTTPLSSPTADLLLNNFQTTPPQPPIPPTPVPSSPQTSFQCTVCSQTFTKLWVLEKHQKLKHSYNQIRCLKCARSFTDVDYLKRHKCFHCEICSENFDKKQDLKQHLQLVHDIKEIQRGTCRVCKAQFLSAKALLQHSVECKLIVKTFAEAAAGAEIYCQSCDKVLQSTKVYEQHKERRNLLSHTCPVCGEGFCSIKIVISHMNNHADVSQHQCVVCNKTFYSPAEFIRHVWSVHEKDGEDYNSLSYKVSFQDKSKMRSRDGFDEGLRLGNESSERVDKIVKKRKTYVRKSRAKDDTVVETVVETDKSAIVESGENILPVLHDCKHCEKSFQKMSSLKLHKRNMHTFRCYNCKSVFPVKIKLLNHDMICSGSANKERDYDDTMVIQSLDEIFKCKQCGEQVTSKGALIQHFQNCKKVKE